MTGVLHKRKHIEEVEFAPRVLRSSGCSPVVLVCEHAAARIPKEFQNLGLTTRDLDSHIAWDPGALETATCLSELLGAPLIFSAVSRLVYDCNRPPEAESAVPVQSETTLIPGNMNLSQAERQSRVERFYTPFEALLSTTLDNRQDPTILVTIHSFTPVYRGERRSVEIGILHDNDSRLADVILQVAHGFKIARNSPYGPDDGVTHTLRQHALPRGILNVMIELRNDLIKTPGQCEEMAHNLACWLSQALPLCTPTPASETKK
ncbi:N-formylglutamate amidohydrolase [Cognatiyoonia sp. IB215182]|uniref:N-formylglutamate amidohydrolase n=1 Tax=Cognatiyoonia sp. IB215182 TaxID=3097353 RepID=UPI002A0EDBD5|nr:N-formylglutamate amidohydrolase [Cognatiyoonia sp. IB215182]MDX8355693.1 N-formylglutamate amidohydrolase [Cognatiyoonia sp. IB215182]